MKTYDDVRARRRAGMAAVAEEGGYLGGPIPYGLELDEWGRWVRHKDQEHILRRIAAWRAAGASLGEICRWLNDKEREPSPTGRRWSPATVDHLLKNPMYYRHGDDVPDHLIGPSHRRASYNYGKTGILHGHPTPKEIDRERQLLGAERARRAAKRRP